jgi:hypothetical protein
MAAKFAGITFVVFNLTRPAWCDEAAPNGFRWDRKPLSSITFDVVPPSRLVPPDVATDEFFRTIPGQAYRGAVRGELYRAFHWAPSGLRHQPLYFEETALERHGQTHSPLLQPLISGAHFFGSAIILPYKIGLDCPHKLVYTLGYDRPGSPARCEKEHLPWSWRGALVQTGAVVGGVFLFP